MPVHPQLLAAAQRHDRMAVDLITDWSFGSEAHLGGSRMPGGWIMGQAHSLLLRGDPSVLAADLAACDAYQEGAARAATLACQSLVLIGEEDRMTPLPAGRELAAAVPDARTVVIPGDGHMMMMERPEETLEALAAFLG
jgi:pimeloyl-ACP methyl ester carboxylesterase